MKKCPYCAEEIQDEAIKCRFCGSDLPKPVESKKVVTRLTPEEEALSAAKSKAANKKVFIVLGLVLGVIMLFATLCTVLTSIGSNNRATSTMTNTPVATVVPPAAGHYEGTNPTFSFDLVEKNGAAAVENFYISIMVNGSKCEMGPVWWKQLNVNFFGDVSTKDNTFKLQSDYEIAPQQPGFLFTGQIDGNTAHGSYTLNFCNDSNITLASPLVGEWTMSSWSLPLTPTPAPLTAIPPISGHYEGTNVSFDVDGREVFNFRFSACGEFTQEGRWFLGSSAENMNDGYLSAQLSNGSGYITGNINGDSAHGKYSLDCGQGSWSAALTWAAPPTPTPTPLVSLKPGHFEGTNPPVSFDLISVVNPIGLEYQVTNFKMTLPFNGTTCSVSLPMMDFINACNNSGCSKNKDYVKITLERDVSENMGMDLMYSSIVGETADGSYEINKCNGVSGPKSEGSWTAHWVSP